MFEYNPAATSLERDGRILSVDGSHILVGRSRYSDEIRCDGWLISV